jgi:hypothetical protein
LKDLEVWGDEDEEQVLRCAQDDKLDLMTKEILGGPM